MIQVDKNHYFNQSYNHKARWLSYWYQIDLVLSIGARSILEVGVGSGIVADYFKKMGLEIKTLDIDVRLQPDIVGSVEKISCDNEQFDCILAAEVLEHLPYEKFRSILREVARVSKKYAVISLPDARKTLFNYYFKAPFFNACEHLYKISSFKRHKFDGQHYWELGKLAYEMKKIKNDIIMSGWNIKKCFTPYDVPTKIFFLLEKK